MNLADIRKSIHWWILFSVLLIVTVFYFNGLFPKWSLKYPTEWRIPLRFWISDLMHWLVSDSPSALNFANVTFKEFTRFLAAVLTYPLDFTIDLYVFWKTMCGALYASHEGKHKHFCLVLYTFSPWHNVNHGRCAFAKACETQPWDHSSQMPCVARWTCS